MNIEDNKPNYQPPYTITPAILNLVAHISEAVGRLTVLTGEGGGDALYGFIFDYVRLFDVKKRNFAKHRRLSGIP